ncbi:MAG: hypothetical protein ABFS42_15725, partial [Candidatus Krumholzibacteriota bacterium]
MTGRYLVFSILFLLCALPALGQDWDWTPAGTPPGVTSLNDIAIDPQVPGTWFLGTGDGLYVTRDFGSSWDHAFSGWILDVVQSPTNSDRLFASARDSLYRSEDRGYTWSLVHVFPGRVQNIHISEADSSVYAGLRWYSDIPSP